MVHYKPESNAVRELRTVKFTTSVVDFAIADLAVVDSDLFDEVETLPAYLLINPDGDHLLLGNGGALLIG
jgi:hypothetical protein